jgi:hypothetical protein
MSMRSYSIGATGAALLSLAIGCSPAQADGDDMQFAGTFGAGWTGFLTSGQASHTNDWLARGVAVLTIDNPGFNVQADFNNDSIQIPSESNDVWSYGGDIYWRDYAGSVGVNATFASAMRTGAGSTNGFTYAEDTFSWFGQWFTEPNLTLEIKGGGFEGHFAGLYGSAGAVFYPYHDIALSLTADYAKSDDHIREQVRDAAFTAEYLPVHDIPVSIYVGYDCSLLSQLQHEQVSAVLVGLNVYLGGGGRNGTLVDYQRNGTTDWGAAPSALLEFGF